MKRINIILVLFLGSINMLHANGVLVGDLYYIINTTAKTAEVTYKNYSEGKYNRDYNIPKNLNIPFNIKYAGKLYDVISIGDHAFEDCDSLISVSISNKVTKLGWHAFANCKNLVEITFNNTPTSIPYGTFIGCNSLTYLHLSGILSVDDLAFRMCRNLKSIDTGDEMTSIGSDAFSCCDSLQYVKIGSKVKSVGARAFESCTNLRKVVFENSPATIGEDAFFNCFKMDTLIFGDSITSIGDYAFSACSSLTSLDIPNTIISIGKRALDGCKNMEIINVGHDNPNYCSKDGILFNKDTTTLINYPASKQGISYDIPNSVLAIEEYAFRANHNLQSISIPNTVTSIGQGAFVNDEYLIDWTTHLPYNTTNLICINIPLNVTKIESSTFSGCVKLTSITIPKNVTHIGQYAFSHCSGLTSVTCLATTPPEMETSVFSNVNCSNIPLYVLGESVDAYRIADQWQEFNPILSIGSVPTNFEIIEKQQKDKQKYLFNGQLLILLGEKVYTVTGQEIK